jgi:hypothetical protein
LLPPPIIKLRRRQSKTENFAPTTSSDNHHLLRLETNQSKMSNFLRCQNVQFAITLSSPLPCFSLSLSPSLFFSLFLPLSRKRTHPKRLQNSFSTNPCEKRIEVLKRSTQCTCRRRGEEGEGRVPVGTGAGVDGSLAQHKISSEN